MNRATNIFGFALGVWSYAYFFGWTTREAFEFLAAMSFGYLYGEFVK